MKFKLLFALLFGSLISVYAQNPGSISGKVIDQSTKETLPYVNIVVKDGANVVTGGITDDNGEFTINNLELKKYAVEVQFMGFKTHTTAVTLSNSSKAARLGTISL